MFRFRLSTIVFFLTAVSLGFAWYIDRTTLRRELQELQAIQHPIAGFWEKHAYWSPSLHLSVDTDELESSIADRVDGLSGSIVESSQGMSHASLRQPSTATIDKVVLLLDDPDHSTRLTAARLLALYLEAVSGRSNTDRNSIEKRAYLSSVLISGLSRVKGGLHGGIERARSLALYASQIPAEAFLQA